MPREDRETAPDGYKSAFGKLFIRWGLVVVDGQIVIPIDLRRRPSDILHFSHSRINQTKIFWWPEKKSDIKTKVKDCSVCLASGKHYGKLGKLTEPGRRIQIDFTGKLPNKYFHGEVQILIAVVRFSMWPIVKFCKTLETKEVTIFIK